jgi:tetratricopeptide (TPR) repeat protein
VSPKPAAPVGQPMSRDVRDKLLEGAMDVLGNLETYDEAVAFPQVFDRLNQWSHSLSGSTGVDGWQLDPLIDTLPDRLRGETVTKGIGELAFDATTDILALRDQRWLSDVAATARGDAIEDLDVARRLFDWTVRSLAAVSDPPMVPSEANPGSRWFSVGEILLAGRASAPQRAWVFLELVRHAGLDGVMLATGDVAAGTIRPWIPAVLCGDEAYLFDPGYGLPVPGPGGEGVATARQAASDPTILAAMSLPDRPYPVQAPDIDRLTVLVPATPWSLSRRMHVLDRQLAGARRVDLALDAGKLAARALASLPARALAALPASSATVVETPTADTERRAGLWEFPWETLARRRTMRDSVDPAIAKELGVMGLAIQQTDTNRETRSFRPLYAARLREFRGVLDGPDGAKMAYLAARPGNAVIAEMLQGLPAPQADQVKRIYDELKGDATYWLGVLTLAEEEYETAVDYLDRMTLKANPDGIWSDAARVNLARARLALGDRHEAVRLLREDASPQRFGSRLLADRIGSASP